MGPTSNQNTCRLSKKTNLGAASVVERKRSSSRSRASLAAPCNLRSLDCPLKSRASLDNLDSSTRSPLNPREPDGGRLVSEEVSKLKLLFCC